MTSGYIPGQGSKKPLNMLEAPIYPDIKKNPIEFKWSKKYWTVDTGQTLLDGEANTQVTLGDSILSEAYNKNITQYGQSTHQEKITVFRPPLQNSYEDYGPLNRLPATTRAIVPRINPGTTDSAGGTTAFKTNNMVQQEVNRYVTDKIEPKEWRSTYYGPIDLPQDNSVLPDLVTTIPNRSISSGYNTHYTFDAPNPKMDFVSPVNNLPNTSYSSGYNMNITTPIQEQSNFNYDFEYNTPKISAHSGYNTVTKIDGETQYQNIQLSNNMPKYSASSGSNNYITIDSENPLTELQLRQQLTTPVTVINPSSEFGYQTTIESYTSPDNYIKLQENPRVPIVAHSTFDYTQQDNIKSDVPKFRTKIQPIKSYGSGLNSGTIKVAGVEEQKVGGKYFANRKTPKVY